MNFQRYKDFSKQSWCRIALIQVLASTKELLLIEKIEKDAQKIFFQEKTNLFADFLLENGLLVDDQQDEYVHLLDKDFFHQLWSWYWAAYEENDNLIQTITESCASVLHWTELDFFTASLLELAFIEIQHTQESKQISLFNPYLLIHRYYNEEDRQEFLLYLLNAMRKNFLESQKQASFAAMDGDETKEISS